MQQNKYKENKETIVEDNPLNVCLINFQINDKENIMFKTRHLIIIHVNKNIIFISKFKDYISF